MNLLAVFGLAFGLAMDALAVSIVQGVNMRKLDLRHAALVALLFGAFQGVMPLLGWLVGSRFMPYIVSVDHWVAFALLVGVGGKMLWDVWRHRGHAQDGPDEEKSGIRTLLMLALATSIDALAVGLSLSIFQIPILVTAGIIAGVTAAVSFAGVWIGHRFGRRFTTAAEVLGGVILIGIGASILFEHLTS